MLQILCTIIFNEYNYVQYYVQCIERIAWNEVLI